VRRRTFIANVLGTVAAATVTGGLVALNLPRDEYGEFLERVGARVRQIVRENGRGVHRMWIDSPQANGDHYVRLVNLTLVAGPSLLDKIVFCWYERSGSRWSEIGRA
jgi:hypothetical protein